LATGLDGNTACASCLDRFGIGDRSIGRGGDGDAICTGRRDHTGVVGEGDGLASDRRFIAYDGAGTIGYCRDASKAIDGDARGGGLLNSPAAVGDGNGVGLDGASVHARGCDFAVITFKSDCVAENGGDVRGNSTSAIGNSDCVTENTGISGNGTSAI